MEANTYISNKSFNSFFKASVLTSLITQLQTLADGLIVSNLVSPHAISAVSLTSPVFGILTLVPMMFSMGASILAANEIGAQNYREASLHFTVSTAFTFVTVSVFGITACIFSDRLACLLTDEPQILPLVKSYFPPMTAGFFVIAVSMMMANFVKLAGRPVFVTKTVFCQFLTNVVLDLVFVGAFGMGIGGAAIATILSALVSILMFLPFLVKGTVIRFVKPDTSLLLRMFVAEVKKGVPFAASQLSLIVLIICLNAIILRYRGADGLFILTVSIQMLMICSLVLFGAGSAVTSIGGIMLGERNLNGYRSLINGIILKISVAVAVLSGIMICFPGFLARIFGASGDFLDSVTGPIREMCFLFLPFSVCTLYTNFLTLQNRKGFASLIGVGIPVFMIPPLLLSAAFFPDFFWMSVPAGVWLLLAVVLLSAVLISRRNPVLNRFTLIPSVPDDPSVNLSVPYSMDDVAEAISQIKVFVNVCELSPERKEALYHSIEELSLNIIGMNSAIKKKGFFDIRIVYAPDAIYAYLKDDSRPYNPIVKYDPTSEDGYTAEKVECLIANYFCPDLKYDYMNGINCISMKFEI